MVSVTPRKPKPETQKREPAGGGGSRYERVVEAITSVGIEEIERIDLWARASNKPGRYTNTEYFLEVVSSKESPVLDDAEEIGKVPDTIDAEGLADRLYELAREYEDTDGPRMFQARIKPRTGRFQPVTFETSEGGAPQPESAGEVNAAAATMGRTMRNMETTMGKALKHMESMMMRQAETDGKNRTTPEVAAVLAKVELEIAKMKYDREDSAALFSMLDARAAQIISELAPGIRSHMEQEPDACTLPDRMREWLEGLSETEDEAFRAAAGDNLYSVIRDAANAENNTNYRAIMAKLKDEISVMSKDAYSAYKMRLVAALPPEQLKRLAVLLKRAGL